MGRLSHAGATALIACFTPLGAVTLLQSLARLRSTTTVLDSSIFGSFMISRTFLQSAILVIAFGLSHAELCLPVPDILYLESLLLARSWSYPGIPLPFMSLSCASSSIAA